MTALRHHPPSSEEERMTRIENTLRAASDWEPETEAPEDLTARVVARLETPSFWQRLRRYGHAYNNATWWSVGGVGLTAAALMGLRLLAPISPEALMLDSTAKTAYAPVSRSTTAARAGNAVRQVSDTLPRSVQQVETFPVEMATAAPETAGGRFAGNSDAATAVQPVGNMVEPKPSSSRDTAGVSATGNAGIRTTTNRTVRRRPKRLRPEPIRLAYQPRVNTRSTAANREKPVSVWSEETVVREPADTAASPNYTVLIPVVYTRSSPETGEVTSVPVMMEVTYPNGVPRGVITE
ncbi:MAG: hypothetical protein OHK0029_09570 [Armatimonadaceae bacterium]